IDAVPDVTNIQVQINTNAPGLSPIEVERQITFPIEVSMSGVPGIERVRSISKFGLSQVTVIFDDSTSIYFARQLVEQRLQVARSDIAPGLGVPEMGPISTGLGEVFQYTITSDTRDATELRTIQDWSVRPHLRTVRGVAEVNPFGGFEKQYQVLVRPELLLKYKLTLHEVLEALAANNENRGGGYIEQDDLQHVVHGIGRVQSLEQIRNIVVASHDGIPIRVQDVGDVEVGAAIRYGAVTKDGHGEVVIGIVMMLMGSNSRVVVQDVKKRFETIQKSLPPDVKLTPFYDRTGLVERTIRTVEKNLLEGCVLVLAVLLLLLGDLRAGIVVALAIPVSFLVALTLMVQAGIAGSLMSLQGVEGKLFRPMAATVIFALLGSLVFSLAVAPVLASYLLPAKPSEKEPRVVRGALYVYEPALGWALRHGRIVLALAAASVLAAAAAASLLGSEFIPRLEEGALLIEIRRPPGLSLAEVTSSTTAIERRLREAFPDEVESVVSKSGRPEIATDHASPNNTDVMILLRPVEQWKRAHDHDSIVALVDRELRRFMGITYQFSQPIEMRMNELNAGVRSDVAIKVFGEDLGILWERASAALERVARIPGASGFRIVQVSGLPMLRVRVMPDRLARYGVNARTAMEIVEAVKGVRATEILEGHRRFPLVLRLPQHSVRDAAALADVVVSTPSGVRVPLGALCTIDEISGPEEIAREQGERVIVIAGNVSGRDLGGFVGDARAVFDGGAVALPQGYRVEWGGQYENLVRARARLVLVVPAALFLILVLLVASQGTLRRAVLIFTGIPFAVVGGVAALLIRDMPFSISAGIGFIAVSGVAVLDGLVMVSSITQLLAEGRSLDDAVHEGALHRLRPVLTTALVASLGFVPMALSTSAGAEVQRPLATVVIGGLVTSTLLSLVVVPVLFRSFGGDKRRAAAPAREVNERAVS
ncbi:MAG: efflux RND transporter permease subunit, partial [Planctomycetota bacterium]